MVCDRIYDLSNVVLIRVRRKSMWSGLNSLSFITNFSTAHRRESTSICNFWKWLELQRKLRQIRPRNPHELKPNIILFFSANISWWIECQGRRQSEWIQMSSNSWPKISLVFLVKLPLFFIFVFIYALFQKRVIFLKMDRFMAFENVIILIVIYLAEHIVCFFFVFLLLVSLRHSI